MRRLLGGDRSGPRALQVLRVGKVCLLAERRRLPLIPKQPKATTVRPWRLHLTMAVSMFSEMDMHFWLEKAEAESKTLA